MTNDDEWDSYLQQVKPITKVDKVVKISQPLEVKANFHSTDTESFNHAVLPTEDSQSPLVIDNLSALNKRHAQRLKAGQLEIDVIIDLHNLTLDNATQKLHQTIKTCFQQQHRLILVITGKGKNLQGKIKINFAPIINNPMIRPMIVAAAIAAKKDGGSGAYYLLLKKHNN